MNHVLAGAAAGLAATAPMSAAMKAMHARLPREQQYPLPPRQVTVSLARTVGLAGRLDEDQQRQLTLAGHFAYGAVCGAIYGAVSGALPGHPVARGTAFGLAVWTASYLGWIPAARIMPPATRHPPRRTALMIAAHIVWGAALGLVFERLAAGGRLSTSACRQPAGVGARAAAGPALGAAQAARGDARKAPSALRTCPRGCR